MCHVLKTSPCYILCVPVHEVGQEIMKIIKSLTMEVKKSFFIPNSNKQDGNKTLKANHKHGHLASCHCVMGFRTIIDFPI